MTTYNVINSNDSGTGSLREAINQANANPGQDKIEIELANINLNSAINITDSVEITGNNTLIQQSQADRLFLVDNANDDILIDVLFNNLTLTGGNSDREGGAIYSAENLSLNEVEVTENTAVGFGGGIFHTIGSLTITDSNLNNNETINDANENSEGGGLAAVGLIGENGTVTINNSVFEQNTASLGAILIENALVAIEDSQIINNDSRGIITLGSIVDIDNILVSGNNGSGIIALGVSTVNIDSSTFQNNVGNFGGGISSSESNLFIKNSLINNNTGNNTGGGLSIAELSDLEIENSIVSNNSSPVGSGIETFEQSTATISDSYITGNTGGEQIEGEGFTFEGTNSNNPLGVEITANIGYQEPVEPSAETSLQITNIDRFFQNQRGFHFYTADAGESLFIQEQSAQGNLSYNYEGESFATLSSDRDGITGEAIAGAEEVYRLFNNETGAHLFTMDEAERDFILNSLNNYSLEGIAYYAFESEQDGIDTVPLYRMLNTETGTHLFTSDSNEFNYVQNNLDHFNVEANEGIAFYVMEI